MPEEQEQFDGGNLPITCHVHVRGIDKAKRTAHFVCSTDVIDSYGERVEQVWNLKRFLTNPVILFAHKSRDLPIGKASNVGVLDGKLQCDVELLSQEANPLTEQILNQWAEGMLLTGSVGFIPHSYRWEMEGDREILILSDNELLEFSVTPVPANPEALGRLRARALDVKKTTAASRGLEKTHMDLETLKARLAAVEAERDAKGKELAVEQSRTKELTEQNQKLSADLTKASAAVASLEKENTALATERDSANARAEKAELDAITKEVDALLGDKADPAEKDDLIALAKMNRDMFDRQMARRTPKRLFERTISQENADSTNTTSEQDPVQQALKSAKEGVLNGHQCRSIFGRVDHRQQNR